jgi:hypothetical protein
MKRLSILAVALAAIALCQPAHAFGGRSRSRVVVRQQVVVQRQRFVVAQPVVVQQFHAVPVQQIVVPTVQQVVVPSCSSFFVH